MKIIAHSLLVIFLSGVAQSCTDPSDVGIEVQPASDQIGVVVTDTFFLDVSVVEQDSIRTDEQSITTNLVGKYFDPVFGISGGTFYSQIRLPNNNSNFSFGTAPVLDSIVLTLEYSGYYGDTATQQNFEVYRLDESLESDSNYFSNSSAQTGALLFSGLLDVTPKDSVNLDGVNRAPHLRIRLDDALGNEFLDPANSGSFADNNSFIQFFKGVHVKTNDMPASGSGSIVYINLLASLSKLSVYYSNADADSLTANFEINGACPRFNTFEHDYSTSQFGNTFPLSGSNKAYLQSMAGLKTRIKIPGLDNLKAEGPVSINKAEFVFSAEDIEDFYPPHSATLLFGLDSSNADVIIVDLLESPSYYGGTFNSTDETYHFNVARHIQRIISDQTNNYGFSLVSTGAATNANRTVLKGPARTDGRMYLKITYSKLN